MFELANPLVLLLIPIPILIWFLVPKAPLYLPIAMKIPFFNDISGRVQSKHQKLAHFKTVIPLFLVWLLIVIALAGPRWVGEPRPIEREGYNIMLALDLSGSMELNDMMVQGRPVSRLSVVKYAAEQFVKARKGDRLGLILFGSHAYLQTPLTYDHHNLLLRIEDATVGLAGKTTSIGDALGLAVKSMLETPKKGRVIILLTDGANNSGVLSPEKSAILANEEGIKVYTIGLGAESDPDALNQMLFNMSSANDLDEDALKEVASITGGRYFRATDLNSLQGIYQKINQLERIRHKEQSIRPQKDYYPWPLGVGIFVLMLWFSTRCRISPLLKHDHTGVLKV